MMKKYNRGASKSVYNIYTESWIYACEPETKQQSTVWVFQDEPNPTKVVRARSTSKHMVAYFFGINGHVATVPLVKRCTVDSEWYTTICLPVLFPSVKNKLRGQRFLKPKEAVEAFKTHVLEIPQSEWKNCYENWFKRMQKCVNLNGQYFEKQ